MQCQEDVFQHSFGNAVVYNYLNPLKQVNILLLSVCNAKYELTISPYVKFIS